MPQNIKSAALNRGWNVASAILHVPGYARNAESLKDTHNILANGNPDLPIGTPAQTWKSAAKLAGAGIVDGPEFDDVIKAAVWHGIGEDVEEVFQRVLPKVAVKDASEEDLISVLEETCALVYRDKDGKPRGCYRCKTASDVAYSSDQLAADMSKGRLPMDIATQCARKIVKRAAELGATDAIHPKVLRIGEERLPDFNYARELLGPVYKTADAIKIANDIVDAMECAYEEGRGYEDLIPLSQLLSQLSEVAPGSATINPESLVFSGPRIADIDEQAKNYVIILNVPVPKEELLGLSLPEGALSLEELQRVAGLLDAIENGSQQLPAIPQDLQRILLEALIQQ